LLFLRVSSTSRGKAFHLCRNMAAERASGRKTVDIMERTMREIARRAKRIGASWGDIGLLAILKFLLKRYFDKEGYQRYWNRHYNQGACKATLIPIQAVKS
jgi:hypothetical protein